MTGFLTKRISCSHWGMFPVPNRFAFVVPVGFKIPEDARIEWEKPGGMIEIVRA